MERLQIAIEKARANRQKARVEGGGTAELQVEAPVETPVQPDVDALWEQLPELTVSPKLLRRNLVVTTEPNALAMPFDHLRTRIAQTARRNGWKKIAIVSSHPSAGKTTLSANLSFSFARQSDMRVMVLDYDMRRPGLAAILGQKPAHSMPDVIQGIVPFAEHGCRYGANLAFGFNRQGVKNASEILQSRRNLAFIEKLDETYAPDILLFDMPPVLVADDALGFLSNVDAVLIVAAAERTPLRQVDQVESQITELTQVMGVVLNRCNYMERGSGYYDSYQY